jgi:transcription antitermination factor NusG
LDLECFLPKVRQEQFVCGIPRLVTKPLFRGYFFSRFCPVLFLEAVSHARGVVRVLGTTSFPVPVAPEVIAAIQERIQEEGFLTLDATHFLPGDKVNIETGPFAGLVGQVEREFDDGRRVAILLEAIQHARVELEKRWVTRAVEA